MNLKRMIPWLGLLAVVSLSGCALYVVTPNGGTVPTCPGCTLAWGPSTVVTGTVYSMTSPNKTYTSAWVVVDHGANQFPVGMMLDSQPFMRVITPGPATKPVNAQLFLYYKYGNTSPGCDIVTIPTIK
jgi:hypothetical protein